MSLLKLHPAIKVFSDQYWHMFVMYLCTSAGLAFSKCSEYNIKFLFDPLRIPLYLNQKTLRGEDFFKDIFIF